MSDRDQNKKNSWLFQTSNFLIKKIDVIAAFLGVGVGVIIFSLFYLSGSDMRDIGVTVLCACVLYLFLRTQNCHRIRIQDSIKSSIITGTSVIFWFFFTISLLLLYFNLYQRPLLYFIIISFLAGIIAFEILVYNEEQGIFQIFVKIFVLSVQVRAGIWYNFPTFSGSDVYFHASIINAITMNGHLPSVEVMSKYFYTPVSYFLVSVVQLASGENSVKNSIFILAFVISILLIFVYLIGKELVNPRIGLLAALLAGLMNSVIQYAFINYTPSVLAFCYFLIILFLILKIIHNERKYRAHMLLLLFLSVMLIYTHELSVFVVFISIMTIFIVYLFFNFFQDSQKNKVFLYYVIIFSTTLFFQWMTSFVYEDISFFEFVFRPFFFEVSQGGGSYDSTILIKGMETSESIIDQLISNSPYLLPVFLTIGGVLHWLKSVEYRKYQIIVPIIVLYGIIFGIPLFGMRNLLTERWLPFVYVFSCFVIAAYIFHLTDLCSSIPLKRLTTIVIVVLFIFTMVITPGINKDNPIIRTESTVRNQFTDAEVASMNSVNTIAKDSVISDSAYLLLQRSEIANRINYDPLSIEYVMGTNNFEMPESIILIRKCGMNEPFSFPMEKRGIYDSGFLPEDFIKKFESNKYNLVYSNKQIDGYFNR